MSAPTADDFRRAIAAATSRDVDDIWRSICLQAQVPAGALLLDLEQATALAAAMAGRPGRLGVAGRMLAVRVNTYAQLSDRTDATQGFPVDWASPTLGYLLRERPVDDSRAEEIASLDLFSPAAQARFETAAERLMRLLSCSIGLITLVGEDAQLFLGSHGLPDWAKQANGTPVEWSFCATTVRTGEPYVVNDARAHVVHRSNPLVTSQGIASYAGAPLVTSSGHVLGACCVLDIKPREFTELDVAELSSAAASLVHSFEIPNDAAA